MLLLDDWRLFETGVSRSWGFSWELRVFIKLIKGLFAHERVHFNYVGTIFSTDVNLIKRGSFEIR